jgi:RimJ/RimL family protein N-acetyltransferase
MLPSGLANGLLRLSSVMNPSAEAPTAAINSRTSSNPAPAEWRVALPTLSGRLVRLREVTASDAPALREMLAFDDAERLIAPPPPTIEGFERFIEYMRVHRHAGTYVCFAVVPHGTATAAGLFQIRQLECGFRTAEWGFAFGPAYWGSGLFADGARLVLEFVFETLGVERLEARAALLNGRGNGALRKMGAEQELVLRRAFLHNGQYVDQALWSILASDWREGRCTSQARALIH